MYQPDSTDLRILLELQHNSRLTIKELASIVNLSSTPVYDRVKRLEREGYIKKYVAILDYDKLNRGFAVFCNLKLTQINPQIANQFTEFISNIPEVVECYNVSGEYDYLLKVITPDMKHYQSFLINTLGEFNYIAGVQSVFIMEEVKQTYGIVEYDK
ncbi:MAG: Lrp/AsnC family transcriptional regulator [Fermentimonas sp.]|jgi:Lrp/AsnC family leucine-responsive transcriptional regulator